MGFQTYIFCSNVPSECRKCRFRDPKLNRDPNPNRTRLQLCRHYGLPLTKILATLLSAHDAKSLLKLYRCNPGAGEMFPQLPNTEQADYRIRHHGIQFSFEIFSVIHLTIFCIHKRLVYCRNAEYGIRGLTFRLKIPRRRETFLSFGRGQDPFGIIRTFVMKITFILFIQQPNLFLQIFCPLVQHKSCRLLATTLSKSTIRSSMPCCQISLLYGLV